MIGSQRLLPDRQRSLLERLGIGVAVMGTLEHRKVLEDVGNVGMYRWAGVAQYPEKKRVGVNPTPFFLSAPDLMGPGAANG